MRLLLIQSNVMQKFSTDSIFLQTVLTCLWELLKKNFFRKGFIA